MNEVNKQTPVIQSLLDRKSVRVFLKKPINTGDQETILLAAAAAPSAGNQQLYTILNITDETLKTKLSITCDNQPFIADAPFVLIFCADCQKWYDAYRSIDCVPRNPSAGDLMLAVEDCAIAAQNAVTAAWSLGIGSCYIGDIMENHAIHKELLNLPDFVFPAVMVVFGYPSPKQLERQKPQRCDLAHIVMENTYSQMDSEQLKTMLSYKAGYQSYEAWLTAFCNRKYNSDFSVEMARSVHEYLKIFLK